MENCEKVMLGLCGAAVVGVLAYAGATSFGTEAYTSTNMAYWVQAIGSIGAIIGAFAVGQSQIRAAREQAQDQIRADRDQAQEDLRAAKEQSENEQRAAKERDKEARRHALESKQAASRAIIAAAYSEIERFTNLARTGTATRKDVRMFYRGEVLSGLINSVQSIPVFELEKAEVSVCILGFQNAMLSLREIFVDFDRPLYMSAGQPVFAQHINTTEIRNYIIAAYVSYDKILKQFPTADGESNSIKSPPFESNV
ncbi:hypothetical protein [Burkholderia cenocepacia]|uniref:hypothetical protein n=1 Tax=Burkholderia cenocepacia TaxID=95486 RepID=UPI002ABDB960|nr:hypothetical protein [Burkholderia cenocepacia]